MTGIALILVAILFKSLAVMKSRTNHGSPVEGTEARIIPFPHPTEEQSASNQP